jgi:GT2 family glycosyltransferase
MDVRNLICPGMISPWHSGGDLGAAYNEWLDLLKDRYAWIVFKDHDVEMMHRDWFAILEGAIELHPQAGAFTCKVNRQHAGNISQSLHIDGDMGDTQRIELARTVRERGREKVTCMGTDTRHLMSGCWFAVNVDAVRAVGGFSAGFQGVDWDIHRKLDAAGFPVCCIEGLFCWHRYRHPAEV